MEQENIKEFTESFFKSLGCTLSYNGKKLEVKNVPPQFENFVGKKGPFIFSFQEGNPETEVLKKGGYFLTAMTNYLKTKSKITLIKLDFNLDEEKEILARFTFPNAKIEKISSSYKFETATRFLFTTGFQYLNEKERETIPIFIKDSKLFDLDLVKMYPSVEGNKKEVTIPDFSQDYEIAKEALKKRVHGKIQRVSRGLTDSLQKELQRIQLHYQQQIREIDAEKESINSQIKKTEEELSKKPNDEKLLKRLEKIKETLAAFDGDERKKVLEKEMELSLQEEKNRCKLHVSHSLMNTSLIYYPVYRYVITLVNEKAVGNLAVEFDPVQKHMNPFICPGTGKKEYKVLLDDAGVACSKESLLECFESGNLYCNANMKTKCSHSGRQVHPSNAGVCSITKKHFGKSYLKEDFLTGKLVYQNLLKLCPVCSKYTLEKKFIQCPNCKTKVCPNEIKKVFIEGKIESRCKICERV